MITRTVFLSFLLPLLVASLAYGGELSREEAWKEFRRLNQERSAQGKPPLTFRDLTDLWSDAEKKRYMQKVARDSGFFLDIKKRWELIDDPTTALGWSYKELEPFPQGLLDTLERTLPLSTDSEEKVRIAALLYRYGRGLGREVLLQELPGPEGPTAASVFAQNRDPEARPPLMELFETEVLAKEEREELIYALGRWAPETTALLSKGFLARRGSPAAYVQTFCAAPHQVDEATLQRLQQLYTKANGSWKADLAKTLYHVSPKYREPLAYLITQAKQWSDLPEMERSSVLKALADIDLPQTRQPLKPMVRGMVEEFLADPEAWYTEWPVMNAALVLLEVGENKDKQLVIEMLRRRAERERPPYSRTVSVLLRAIAESELPQAEEALQAIVGDKVLSLLHRFQETQELRPLPAHLLPEPSRNFVRTSHWRKTPLRKNNSGES